MTELEQPTMEEYSYLTERFNAVIDKLDQIDQILSEAASGWRIKPNGKGRSLLFCTTCGI